MNINELTPEQEKTVMTHVGMVGNMHYTINKDGDIYYILNNYLVSDDEIILGIPNPIPSGCNKYDLQASGISAYPPLGTRWTEELTLKRIESVKKNRNPS